MAVAAHLLLLILAPPPAAAARQLQPATSAPAKDGLPVAAVRFSGLLNVDEGYARSVVRTRPGEPYSAATTTGDVDRLFRTGKFDDVRVESIAAEGRVTVTFTVVERPLLESVEIVGNRRFKTSKLLEEIELAAGSPISDYALRRAVDAIVRKYREAGYYYADVQYDAALLRDQRRAVLTISEGPRVRIRAIRFEGATAFSAFTLRQRIETSTYIWIFRKGDLDEERLARDAAALQQFYRDEGYLDAAVGTELAFAANGADLTVVFQIKEGVRYAIRTVNFKGNTVYSAERLASDADLKLTPGAPLTAERLKRDIKAVQDVYWRSGYIYADVSGDWVYAAEPGLVDLTLSVQEGEQFRFGRIRIRGNQRTRDKVIRRELPFLPDALYDRAATEEVRQRLIETRLFSDVLITPVGEDRGVRDALIEVTEADTTSILFAVGVTTNSGVVGGITLENRNFDISDWPRNWDQFFSRRSFRGAGQTLRLQFEPGTELTRLRLDFREPYLFDRPLGFNIAAYLFTRDFDEYDERRVGLNTSFDHRFRHGPLRNWAAEAAFRVENVKVDGLDALSDRNYREVRGNNLLTSVKGTLVRNTTDSFFLPSRGNRLSFSWEQYGALGGDFTFAKLIGDYSHYFTLHTDTFDRKHVLAAGATAGQIVGDAPPFERFFGGGIGSIRGFDFRGISPRGGAFIRDDEAIGGDFLLLAGTEYSFPVAGKILRGVTFLDMGTVEESTELTTWRAAVGVGLRVYIPFFGPIPLSFDLGWPVSRDDDDERRVFNFAFGTTF